MSDTNQYNILGGGGEGNHSMTYKPHKGAKPETILDEDGGENVHC